jgi:hypothetical protein
MDLFDLLDAAWGWTGLVATEVIGENAFGKLMICASDGRYWRLCPKDLDCKVSADDRAEFDAWQATRSSGDLARQIADLADGAQARLG